MSLGEWLAPVNTWVEVARVTPGPDMSKLVDGGKTLFFFLSHYMQKKPSSWIDHVEGHTSIGQRQNHRPIMCPLHTWDAKVVISNGWCRGHWWWWKEFYAHHLFLLLRMLIPFFFLGIWERLLTKIIPDNYRTKKESAFSPLHPQIPYTLRLWILIGMEWILGR